jgi:hypothetical protein
VIRGSVAPIAGVDDTAALENEFFETGALPGSSVKEFDAVILTTR